MSFGPPSAEPILAGTGGDTWDRKVRERGWVMREGDGWHLWYTGYNDARSDSRFLGYATSPDGLAWTRWPGNPLTAEGWVEDMSVVKHGGTYYMFAEGRDDIAHLLTSKDRVHWKEQGSLDIRQVDGRPISAVLAARRPRARERHLVVVLRARGFGRVRGDVERLEGLDECEPTTLSWRAGPMPMTAMRWPSTRLSNTRAATTPTTTRAP